MGKQAEEQQKYGERVWSSVTYGIIFVILILGCCHFKPLNSTITIVQQTLLFLLIGMLLFFKDLQVLHFPKICATSAKRLFKPIKYNTCRKCWNCLIDLKNNNSSQIFFHHFFPSPPFTIRNWSKTCLILELLTKYFFSIHNLLPLCTLFACCLINVQFCSR